MEKEQILAELGLTKNQAKIYLAVLQTGISTVRTIAKKTGFQRPNIYDILEELKEKGLITYIQQGKSSHYKAVDPEQFMHILREKQELLDSILPSLKKEYVFMHEDVDVQVYKGEQGMKSSLNKMLNFPSITVYGINIAGQLRRQLPVFAKQYMRRRKEQNIKFKAIYNISDTTGMEMMETEFRYQKTDKYNPTTTYIYADIVLIQLWQPFMIGIEIKSKEIATSYMQYFETLWKNASKKPFLED